MQHGPDPAALDALARLQADLAASLDLPDTPAPPRRPLVLALDAQYEGDAAHVGAALEQAGEPRGLYAGVLPVDVPYVPGFFCFREGPPLLALLAALRARGVAPDVLLVDGHGIAHPRRFGVACWLGLAAGLPAVGCAKQSLLPWEGALGDSVGAFLPVLLDDRPVGCALRTRHGVRPVFVSPGHAIGVDAARGLVHGLRGRYRIPEALRRADRAARRRAAGERPSDVVDLGVLAPARPGWEASG